MAVIKNCYSEGETHDFVDDVRGRPRMRRNLGRRSNCAAFPDIAQGTKVGWSLNLEPSASAWRRLRRIRSLCICSSFKMTRRHHILIYTRQLEKYPVVAMRRIFVDFLAGAASLSKNLGRHKQPRSPVAIHLIGMVGRLAKSTVESPAAVLQCPGMKTQTNQYFGVPCRRPFNTD